MNLDLHLLNPEQFEATTHVDGPLLILAGAGSGKTRVLTHRVGHLIDQGVDPKHILAVSFTNKAAHEMAERVSKLIGPKYARKVHMSTFHSLGHEILRRDIDALGYKKPFTILDSVDQQALVRQVFADLALDPKLVDPKAVLSLVSKAKMALTQPAQLEKSRFSPETPFAQRVFRHYQSALKGLNAVDFDDLLALPVRIFRADDERREWWAKRFRYVMIDEFQDTNHTQLEFMHELVKDHHNICVVGDDDQSIYAFRGAVSSNILEFEHNYEGTKVIKLEQNYRSTNHILDAANAVIAHNVQRKAKTLWSAKGDGELLRWVECASEREEAEFVAVELRRLKEDLSWSWRDFAILYRVNPQARLFEEALRQEDIPYEVIGGQEFYDRKEVKDVVAYLRLCLNPDDENAARRIVNVPNRGIGAILMERLSDFALVNGLTFYETLGQAALKPGLVDGIGHAVGERLEAFVALIDEFHDRFHDAQFGQKDMAEEARELVQRLHFDDYLRSQEKSQKIAARRVDNVDTLLSDLHQFGQRHGGDLDKYLTRLALDRSAHNKDPDVIEDTVRLMTLHTSKGLEFPGVFLVGMEDGYLPHQNALDNPREIPEERRLAYVGITRAKELLTMTNARVRMKYGKELTREPSIFLSEIPTDLVAHERGANTDSLARHQQERNTRMLALAKEMLGF